MSPIDPLCEPHMQNDDIVQARDKCKLPHVKDIREGNSTSTKRLPFRKIRFSTEIILWRRQIQIIIKSP